MRASAPASAAHVGATLAAIAAIGTSLVLPGLGLVIAGPLAAGLAGAGAGGVTGGLIGALIGAGIPEERVKHYEEGIKHGGILMGVTPRSDEDARHFETRWQEHQGQHVLGTGAGAAAGAVTGAGIGAVAGPVGMAAGAAIGGVAGGLAGKGAAEVVNPKPGDDLGDHNLAKGVGAGGGAATGAALGAVGGPSGMAAGRRGRRRRGGLAGKGAGEVANPNAGRRSRPITTSPRASALAAAPQPVRRSGAVGGPVGMAAGAAVGAVAGGLAGKGAGEVANPKRGDELADHHLATASVPAAVRSRARPSAPSVARSAWPRALPSVRPRAVPPERARARSSTRSPATSPALNELPALDKADSGPPCLVVSHTSTRSKPCQFSTKSSRQSPLQPAKREANAIDLLKKDHDDVDALFKDYEMLAEGDGDAGDRRALSTRICGMLAVHAMIEEEIFYPAARKADVDADLLDEAEIEHGSAKELIAQIGAARRLGAALRRASEGARRVHPPSREGRGKRALPGVPQVRHGHGRDRRASSEAQGPTAAQAKRQVSRVDVSVARLRRHA